jgi:hypothetical protein
VVVVDVDVVVRHFKLDDNSCVLLFFLCFLRLRFDKMISSCSEVRTNGISALLEIICVSQVEGWRKMGVKNNIRLACKCN